LKKEGRRKKEEGRRKKEEGRRKKEEGRRKKEEGRRKKEEGRRKKEDTMYKLMVFVPVLYFFFCDFSGFFSFPLSSSPLIINHFCFPILSFSSTSIR